VCDVHNGIPLLSLNKKPRQINTTYAAIDSGYKNAMRADAVLVSCIFAKQI
jgi:hypothetical protein